jgi:hypothetical protein
VADSIWLVAILGLGLVKTRAVGVEVFKTKALARLGRRSSLNYASSIRCNVIGDKLLTGLIFGRRSLIRASRLEIAWSNVRVISFRTGISTVE